MRRRLEHLLDASQLLTVALFAGIGYLSGSLPFGVIVAKLTGGPDPRTIGSGRTGGTNALRALGRRRAFVVTALDVLKGAGPVLLARYASGGDAAVEIGCAIGAVLGSSRSIFLGFVGGGRGVGTGVGTMLVIQPIPVLAAVPIFAAVIVVTRYVSLGSLVGSAAMVVMVVAFWAAANGAMPLIYPVYAALGTGLVWLAHADNIVRLVRGTERKFDLGLITGGRREA